MTGAKLITGEQLFIVGDIHGCSEQLSSALNDSVCEDRKIILLGDYIDRGPDSSGVLDLLVQAQRDLSKRLVLLRGNHEAALLELLESGRSATFLRNRGATTMRVIHAEKSGIFPAC